VPVIVTPDVSEAANIGGALRYVSIDHFEPQTSPRPQPVMNGGKGNMADLFGKMMEMQQKMSEAQENLASKSVTAEAGGGMVKVTANGAQRVTAIEIEREVVDPDDLELLEDLIISGVNKALDEASEMAKQEMQKSAGGLLPPGMDLSQLGL
jgi:DNA-binding YbaB/EbfC family protein